MGVGNVVPELKHVENVGGSVWDITRHSTELYLQ